VLKPGSHERNPRKKPRIRTSVVQAFSQTALAREGSPSENSYFIGLRCKSTNHVDRSEQRVLNRSKRRKQRQSFFFSDKRVVIQRAHWSREMKLVQGNRSRNLNLCYLCLLLFKNSLLTSVSECVYHFCNSAPARSQHQATDAILESRTNMLVLVGR
jgi:hypothetical protein